MRQAGASQRITWNNLAAIHENEQRGIDRRGCRRVVGRVRALQNVRQAAAKAAAVQTTAEKIAELTDPKSVVTIGKIPTVVFRQFKKHGMTAVTRKVILTGERRAHYLGRHKDVIPHEAELIWLLAEPDAVHLNKKDAQMSVWYRQIDDSHFLRVALWVSNKNNLQNSVHSIRLANVEEIARGEKQGRLIWKK